MPRFLHTADWQIGRTYPRFAVEDAAFLAEARLETVRRIAELASERQADAVLVAGDVFDAQTVSDRTVRRLFNGLQGFTGPWVMIPGNHDAALAAGVWTRARQMDCIPPNVVLLDQPEARLLEEAGCVILAAPLTQRQTHSDLTAWFDEAPSAEGLLRIGLAHGSVAGILPDVIDSGNPIAADRAATARLDYLALGDWHGVRRINARAWYSGTPEPDRFKDNEPGHVLMVDIARAGAEPIVERIQVRGYTWHEWTHQFGVASDIDELERRCLSLAAGDVLALRLVGQVDMQARRRIGRTLAVTQGRVRALEADLSQLQLLPTDADIAALAADGYVGEVLAELRNAAAGGEPQQDEVAAEALNLLAGILMERQP
jgi:DNA repair exonuclease SbcCD nuclease subunit